MKKNLNKKKKSKKQVVEKILKRRSLIFMIIILCLFTVVSMKLADVMIVDAKKYKKNLKELTYTKVEGPSSPRGRIYDRNGKIIVDNKAIKTIYYKKDKATTTEEELKLAYLVAPHLNLDSSKLQDRNRREFYLVKNKEKVKKLITEDEWKKYKSREISSSDIEKLQIERISEEELNALSEEDNKAACFI